MPDIYISPQGEIIDFVEDGMSYLSQVVIDNLLNQITSDLYSPDFGTDLKLLPQQNINSTKEMELKMVLYLEKISDRIKQEQNLNPSFDDEMLESLRLISLTENSGFSTDKTIKRWVAVVRVVTQKYGMEKVYEGMIKPHLPNG
jgi:hypothetical protein